MELAILIFVIIFINCLTKRARHIALLYSKRVAGNFNYIRTQMIVIFLYISIKFKLLFQFAFAILIPPPANKSGFFAPRKSL